MISRQASIPASLEFCFDDPIVLGVDFVTQDRLPAPAPGVGSAESSEIDSQFRATEPDGL